MDFTGEIESISGSSTLLSQVGEIRWEKSGVSSSFLPEKMNRRRITRKDEPTWRQKLGGEAWGRGGMGSDRVSS